jgi:hypothetical protein
MNLDSTWKQSFLIYDFKMFYSTGPKYQPYKTFFFVNDAEPK